MYIRWEAIVSYRTEKSLLIIKHNLEELEDLHNLIELGPHFDTIKSIVITRAKGNKDLTIEAAEQL